MSNSGYPEGCATSCFAMGLADLVFHLYLRAYAQTTIPISYVDNFELLASNCGQLQRGILCTEEWSQMWQMSLDREKSYVWATSAQLRQECQVLGWDLKETAVDLGANMVYGKKHRVSGAVDRMNSVGPLWDLVKRLPAPEWKKLQMLRQCIWPKEFFGVANCPLGKKHVQDLRTGATRSLKRSLAGANPLVALSLQSSMTSDPGFYQFWMVLQTFRRMVCKQPSIVDFWELFMHQFRGQKSHGPFGKLVEVCTEVGWSVHAPGIYDHDGQWHSFLDTTDAA